MQVVPTTESIDRYCVPNLQGFSDYFSCRHACANTEHSYALHN